MLLKGILIVCVTLAFRACDASVFRYSPFRSDYQPHRRFGDLYDPYDRAFFYNPYDPYESSLLESIEVPESTEVPEKEYGRESRQSNTNYVISNEELSWYEARDACRSKGMVLASPYTASKQHDLLKYVRENDLVPIDGERGYWLGSGRFSDDDAWTWESNGQEVGLFGWLPDEPSDQIGENCMELKYDSKLLGWNNFFCFDVKRYVCEKLSHALESDKNTVVDTKDALHDEILKESLVDKENNNPTTTTEREALPTVPEFYPDSIIFRHFGVDPDDTSFIDKMDEDSRKNLQVMDEESPSLSDLSSNPTTTTEQEALPTVRELYPDSIKITHLGDVDYNPDDTGKHLQAMGEKSLSLSDLLSNPTTTTEREALPTVRELVPDSIIIKHLEEVDCNPDTSFIDKMAEDSEKHLQPMDEMSSSISDLSNNPIEQKALPNVQELYPDSVIASHLGDVDYTPDDTSVTDKKIEDLIKRIQAMDEMSSSISDLSNNPTEQKALPNVQELYPDSVTGSHLGDVDYTPHDTSFIDKKLEDTIKHSHVMDEMSPSISDPTNNPTEQEALPNVQELHPDAVTVSHLGDVDYTTDDTSVLDKKLEDTIKNVQPLDGMSPSRSDLSNNPTEQKALPNMQELYPDSVIASHLGDVEYTPDDTSVTDKKIEDLIKRIQAMDEMSSSISDLSNNPTEQKALPNVQELYPDSVTVSHLGDVDYTPDDTSFIDKELEDLRKRIQAMDEMRRLISDLSNNPTEQKALPNVQELYPDSVTVSHLRDVDYIQDDTRFIDQELEDLRKRIKAMNEMSPSISNSNNPTEQKALPNVQELYPTSVTVSHSGDVDYTPDDTYVTHKKIEDVIKRMQAMKKMSQSISDLSNNPTEQKALPNVQELYPTSVTVSHLGDVDYTPDDTYVTHKKIEDLIKRMQALKKMSQSISDLSTNPTEQKALRNVQELYPDSVTVSHLGDVDYTSDDTSFIDKKLEDTKKHSQAMDEMSPSISDLSNNPTEQKALPNVQELYPASVTVNHLGDVDYTPDDTSFIDKKLVDTIHVMDERSPSISDLSNNPTEQEALLNVQELHPDSVMVSHLGDDEYNPDDTDFIDNMPDDLRQHLPAMDEESELISDLTSDSAEQEGWTPVRVYDPIMTSHWGGDDDYYSYDSFQANDELGIPDDFVYIRK